MKDRTIIALGVLAASTILICLGHNGGIVTLIGMVVGWYFGREREETRSDC